MNSNISLRCPILLILVWACGPKTMKETTAPVASQWPNGVTYEIFVQSFADSNGDGIGDLNGVTAKLDYLADLGVEALWLMPINPSPSYHKYDVTDYYGIHPDYGTMDDFKRLLAEAHRRNIRVVMDLVINHCSSMHPWFKAALDTTSEYRDFFVWATEAEIKAAGAMTKEKTGDSDNIHQWKAVPGQKEWYFAFFWSGMPDLNYDNPRVREEIYKVGKFWLTEVGVDGFRLDAAKHIYPDERAEDNHAFWKEFKTTMESYKPDVYLVGEVWADLPTQAPFAQGFSALFNFDMAFSILETVKNERIVSAAIHEHAWKVDEAGSLLDLYNASSQAFHQYNPGFYNTTFLTNHDQNRVMSFLENEEAKARLAASILLSMPGSPYLYYGEEIGMRGMKPDELIREPMLWEVIADSAETTWMIPEYNTRETVAPVAVQQADPNSLLHHYKKWISLRRSSEALKVGDLAPVDLGDDQLLAFTRSRENESLLVIHNLSDTVKTISRPASHQTVIFATSEMNNQPDGVVLPAFSSIVFSSR